AIAIGGLLSVAIALTALVVAWRWGLVGRARRRPVDRVPASRSVTPATDPPAGPPPAAGMTRQRP
ncbi:MAG TPA: hypothetical protein VM347_18710, partial [Nonomuraea sp.]|nr:hypothetical protein [Nonomuraea sp.]